MLTRTYSTFIQVPFLNLMANLQERAGHVLIRLGGNTQEYAAMVDHLDNGRAIAKEQANLTQTVRLRTSSPPRFVVQFRNF
jgi:hypothetical protein